MIFAFRGSSNLSLISFSAVVTHKLIIFTVYAGSENRRIGHTRQTLGAQNIMSQFLGQFPLQRIIDGLLKGLPTK